MDKYDSHAYWLREYRTACKIKAIRDRKIYNQKRMRELDAALQRMKSNFRIVGESIVQTFKVF